ncbi:MAG: lipid-A-disaccharide synthase [Planctomycetota bacterium]
MIATIEVIAALGRESIRALSVPLRALFYLPRRHRWREVAQSVLGEVAASERQDPGEFLAEFTALAGRARSERPHLFLSAGEASGDAHAADLLERLAARDLRCDAFGGPALERAGARLLFPLSEHAVMGFFSVLRELPRIIRAYARFVRLLREDPPDLAVLVDYPGLHLVMARAAKRRGVPVLHYIAPQYWAWGPWRMRRYRRSIPATLTILPFEVAFFRRFGVPALYVGHPLLDRLGAVTPDPVASAASAEQPTLCLLPGSRSAEIRANLPGMLRVAGALRARHGGLRVVVAHENAARADLLSSILKTAATKADLVIGPLAPRLAGARLVLAKSGTGSLESCLHGTPTVVVYRLRSFLAAFGYHNLLSIPYIAAANLIAGRKVVPEFCFRRDRGWDRVAEAALELWADGPARDACLAGLEDVRRRLGRPGASARAAAVVSAFLRARKP